jgi:hypothetical protein
MAYVTRFGVLCLAVVLLGMACSEGVSHPLAASPSPAVVAGQWFLDTEPGIPVAGHAAWLFLEFVPDPTTPPSSPSQLGASDIGVSARCSGCNGSVVAGTAKRYQTVRPEDVYHAGATAGFSLPLTFPSPGRWRLDPVGADIEVRPVDTFEPPLIHVRGTTPLPADCGRDKVADVLKRFEIAYNTGDPELLGSVVQQSIDFSIAGGPVPFIAYGRDPFVAGAVDRHARGERIQITLVHVASDRGGIGLSVDAIRTAPDLPQGHQRLVSKGAMWCSQPQLIHLNFGVVPG